MSNRLVFVAAALSHEPREIIQIGAVELDPGSLEVERLASWLVKPRDWSGVTPACCERIGVDLEQHQRLGLDWISVKGRFTETFGSGVTVIGWGRDALHVAADTIDAVEIDLSAVFDVLFGPTPTLHDAMLALELDPPDGTWDAGANALATSMVWRALAERMRIQDKVAKEVPL